MSPKDWELLPPVPPVPPDAWVPDLVPALPWPSLLGDDSVSNIRFSGRGFIKPTLHIEAFTNQVTLRIDCEHNPEAWAELVLTDDQVGELLARLVLLRRGNQEDTLKMLRGIAHGRI